MHVIDPKYTFYNDVPEPLATEVAEKVQGQSMKSMNTASSQVYYANTAYDGRRVYLRTSEDQALPPFAQDAFVANSTAAWDVKQLQMSHSPFMRQPKALAALLAELADHFIATYDTRGTLKAIRRDETSDARNREPAYHNTKAKYALPNE